jgi:hypothetical protein
MVPLESTLLINHLEQQASTFDVKIGRKDSIFSLLFWLISVISYSFLIRSRINNFIEDKQDYLPDLILTYSTLFLDANSNTGSNYWLMRRMLT